MTAFLTRALRRLGLTLTLGTTPAVQVVTLANTRAAYEQVYATEELRAAYLEPSRLAFYEIVATTVAARAPRSVVDVGCGTGNLLAAIRGAVGPACRLAGVDFAVSGVELARSLVPDADLRAESFETYAPGQRFDVVACTEVLEHLEDTAGMLDLLESLKADGGQVLITVPDGAIDDFPGHVHFWSEPQLRALLEPRGLLEIRRIQGVTLLALLA